MFRALKILFLYIPLGLLLCVGLARVILPPLLPLEGRQFFETTPPVLAVKMLYNMWLGHAELEADPSYGRIQVPGRGHSPWVIRSNLDGRPRMLNFALAPELWLAYDTEDASVYQLWQGGIDFEGAVYNYQHGPQPHSMGSYFYRGGGDNAWRIVLRGVEQKTQIQYLGHFYYDEQRKAGIRFRLSAEGVEAVVREVPEIEGERLVRTLRLESASPGVTAMLPVGDDWQSEKRVDIAGRAQVLVGVDEVRVSRDLHQPVAIKADEQAIVVGEDVADHGKSVIAASDCGGCHNERDRVVGPAYGEIAKRYYLPGADGDSPNPEVVRNTQRNLDSLVAVVRNGGQGRWGQVPMPAHPSMSRDDARAAVQYILGLTDIDTSYEAPLDANGDAYVASYSIEVDSKLSGVHPAFELENVLPKGFEPKVGGLGFLPDGSLLVASWDRDGAVYRIDNIAGSDAEPTRIAEGLQEVLGLSVVGERIFVLQKQELTELIDHDGDGRIDEYRLVSNQWPTTPNFHSFAFGLLYEEGYFYAALSICVLEGGSSCPEQLPSHGKWVRVSLADGSVDYLASGLRTPNGLGFGPNDEIFITDNQGDWLPASKLLHMEAGKFYGSRADFVATEGLQETPPVAWLPQFEIGNSPSQPLLLVEQPYAGQLIFGDVYHGGIKRVFLDKVNGAWQGAVFRFSAGFQGSVNRLARGPDGAIYVGEVGNPPNWGELGKLWFGLERLTKKAHGAFEIVSVKATPTGFRLELSEPLATKSQLSTSSVRMAHWFYHPTRQYGGPKYDYTQLEPDAITLSQDRRTIELSAAGLKTGYVVYLNLDKALHSESGKTLWSHEAWYTLNAIPRSEEGQEHTQAHNTLTEEERAAGWELLFDGESLRGWRNYGGEGVPDNWRVENGELSLDPEKTSMWRMIKSIVTGGPSGDLIYAHRRFANFELSLEWKIAQGGNSGILYFVADEEHSAPWQTGLEMQILDNNGHSDGRIEKHRAGDLYDLIASEVEPVRPPGEWNRVLIRVHEGQVEHWLNGQKILSFQHGGEAWKRLVANSKFDDMPDFGVAGNGFIVLQDHTDPVWFRNIKLRKLQDKRN